MVIVRDVTEHKKIEISLKESEAKYRRLFDNAQDMISLIEMDEHGPRKFIEVNEIGIERLGYTREEFLNMTVQDIIVPHRRAEMPA